MKRMISLALIVMLLLIFTGCGSDPNTLDIIGDCEGYGVAANAFCNRFSLEEMIEASNPRAEIYDLLLIGGDGLTARISGSELSGCTLVYSPKYEWELRSEYHPPSANIKNLASVAVISTSEDPNAVRFVNGDAAQSLTAGQLLLRGRVLQEEGTSHINGRDVTIYTTRWRVPLAELFPKGDRFCAVGINGRTVYFKDIKSCFLEYGGNQIDLLLPDGQKLEALTGVMADPPGFLITETFHDALRFLEQDKRVMIIELDGWGYAMQQRAGNEYAPFLHSLQAQRALACYPPISPVGLAAMLTGATPDSNGVHDRDNRELASEDLFAKAAKIGKTCAYLESRNALIGTSLTPVLSLNDKEIFAKAQQVLINQPDLLFVHFHEIDDIAQQYGPYAQQTLQKIKEIDGYVKILMENYGGRVIVTADHGMHGWMDGGTHGQFFPEDMVVPYVIR